MILKIPDELREEFTTFLEVGLASVTATMDYEEMTPNEHCLISIIQSYEVVLDMEQPTEGERKGR